MKNYEILRNIIENIKLENFDEAQNDCLLLPDCAEKHRLYTTIGAIESQPTEKAFNGIKSAVIALADRLIGRI